MDTSRAWIVSPSLPFVRKCLQQRCAETHPKPPAAGGDEDDDVQIVESGRLAWTVRSTAPRQQQQQQQQPWMAPELTTEASIKTNSDSHRQWNGPAPATTRLPSSVTPSPRGANYPASQPRWNPTPAATDARTVEYIHGPPSDQGLPSGNWIQSAPPPIPTAPAPPPSPPLAADPSLIPSLFSTVPVVNVQEKFDPRDICLSRAHLQQLQRSEFYTLLLSERTRVVEFFTVRLNALYPFADPWSWCLTPDNFETERGSDLTKFVNGEPLFMGPERGCDNHVTINDLNCTIMLHYVYFLLELYRIPFILAAAAQAFEEDNPVFTSQGTFTVSEKVEYTPLGQGHRVGYRTLLSPISVVALTGDLATAYELSLLPQGHFVFAKVPGRANVLPAIVLKSSAVDAVLNLSLLVSTSLADSAATFDIYAILDDAPSEGCETVLWGDTTVNWVACVRNELNAREVCLGYDIYYFLVCQLWCCHVAVGMLSWWSPYIIRQLFASHLACDIYWKAVTTNGDEAIISVKDDAHSKFPLWPNLFYVDFRASMDQVHEDEIIDVLDGLLASRRYALKPGEDSTAATHDIYLSFKRWIRTRDGHFTDRWYEADLINPRVEAINTIHLENQHSLSAGVRKHLTKFLNRDKPTRSPVGPQCIPLQIFVTKFDEMPAALALVIGQPDLMTSVSQSGLRRPRVSLMLRKYAELPHVASVIFYSFLKFPFRKHVKKFLGRLINCDDRWKYYPDTPGIVALGVQTFMQPLVSPDPQFPLPKELPQSALQRWAARITCYGWIHLEWRALVIYYLLTFIRQLTDENAEDALTNLMIESLQDDQFQIYEGDVHTFDSLYITVEYLLIRMGPSVSYGSRDIFNTPMHEDAWTRDAILQSPIPELQDIKHIILREANLIIELPTADARTKLINCNSTVLILPRAHEYTPTQFLSSLLYRNRLLFVFAITSLPSGAQSADPIDPQTRERYLAFF